MNTPQDKTDLRFRNFFQKAGLENPSEEFTGDVMKKIAQLDPEPVTTGDHSLLPRWLGGTGIALLAILGFAGMYYFGIDILPQSFKTILSPMFGSIFDSFKGIFDSVEVSDTTIAIILGFALLVVLERVLSRFKLTKNIYFSF